MQLVRNAAKHICLLLFAVMSSSLEALTTLLSRLLGVRECEFLFTINS